MCSVFRQRLYDLEDSLPDLEFPELIRTVDARAGPDCVDKEKAGHEHEPKTNREVNNDGMEKEFPTTQTAATGDSSTKFEAWQLLAGRAGNPG